MCHGAFKLAVPPASTFFASIALLCADGRVNGGVSTPFCAQSERPIREPLVDGQGDAEFTLMAVWEQIFECFVYSVLTRVTFSSCEGLFRISCAYIAPDR